jgi:multicomponent Na+:H+ antiporter subunit E
MSTTRQERQSIRWVLWQQLPLLIVLVVLWMLLWGTISWISFLSGLVVAVVVTRVFYLPPVELSGRFNPFWFVVFLARFFFDVVVASFLVASQAFRPRGVRSNAVIAVDLVTRSDFIITLTAIAISLIPGSLVVEVDRERSILYLHAIGVEDKPEAEKVRQKVLSVERAIIRAVGSRADVERACS